MVGSVGISAGSINPSASTSWMSWGFCNGDDGVERTTDGMRLWVRFFCGGLGLNDAVSAGVSANTSAGGDSEAAGALVGSQSMMPGLTMRLIVSPVWMLYSFSSLASAKALPLKRSLWVSAGGARG